MTTAPAARRSRRLGRLSADERAVALADPGTFAAWDVVPGGAVVLGFARVQGQPAAIIAHDFRVARGATSAHDARRMAQLIEGASERGAAVFILADSEGGRLSEGPATIGDNAEFLRALADASGRVPLFAGVFGLAAGAAAYAAALCDYVVAIADRSFSFLSGPAVVGRALHEDSSFEDLGGTELHSEVTGFYASLAPTDGALIEQLRALAGFFPSHAAGAPPERQPLAASTTTPALPVATTGYEARGLIAALADAGSWCETYPRWGQAILTGPARLDGRSVMLIASQPSYRAGAIDCAAAQKLARAIRIAAAFGLPIITLADTPGFMPGRTEEAARLLTHGARVISAYAEARAHVPTVAVIVRRAVGGGVVLAAAAATVLAFEGAEVVQMGDAARDAVEKDLAPPTVGTAGIIHRHIQPAALRHEVLVALATARPVSPCPAAGRRLVLLPI